MAELANAKGRRYPGPLTKEAGAEGAVRKMECAMGTRFIAPRAARGGGRGRNWHLSAGEGCQRVREPNLSPLLYKTELTAPPAAEEYQGLVLAKIYTKPTCATERCQRFKPDCLGNKKAAPRLERLFSPFFCKKYLETR